MSWVRSPQEASIERCNILSHYDLENLSNILLRTCEYNQDDCLYEIINGLMSLANITMNIKLYDDLSNTIQQYTNIIYPVGYVWTQYMSENGNYFDNDHPSNIPGIMGKWVIDIDINNTYDSNIYIIRIK